MLVGDFFVGFDCGFRSGQAQTRSCRLPMFVADSAAVDTKPMTGSVKVQLPDPGIWALADPDKWASSQKSLATLCVYRDVG